MRGRIVQKIKKALNPQLPEYIPGLILVATSCVEAGVNFSFQSAYRESCSAASLFQIAGRVNRNDELKEPGNVYSFHFDDPEIKNDYRAFEVSSDILDGLFEKEVFQNNQYTTTDILKMAFDKEIKRTKGDFENLLALEDQTNYPKVAELCKVIPANDTYSVVVNREIIEKLEKYQPVTDRDIQLNSVQIWGYNIKKIGIEDIAQRPGFFKLNPDFYDPDFLGYMTESALNAIKTSKGEIMII